MSLRWQRPRTCIIRCLFVTRARPKPASQKPAQPRSLDDLTTGAHGRRRQPLSSSTTITAAEVPPTRHCPPERKSPPPLPLRAPSSLTALHSAPATPPSTPPIPDPRLHLQPQTWRAHTAERTAPSLHPAPACTAIATLYTLFVLAHQASLRAL